MRVRRINFIANSQKQQEVNVRSKKRKRKFETLISKDKPPLPSFLLEVALFSGHLTPPCWGDEWLKIECRQSSEISFSLVNNFEIC